MTGEGEGGEGGENCHPLITSLLNEGAVIINNKKLNLHQPCCNLKMYGNLDPIVVSFPCYCGFTQRKADSSAHFPQMAHMLCVADFILSGRFVIHWKNFGVEPNDYPLEKALI